MTNYVKEYQRLEKEATAAEAQVDRSRRLADEKRYEQCRMVFDAVGKAGYTQAAFAGAVGLDARTISRRMAVWAKWGNRTLASRPSFGEAWAGSVGSTQAEESNRKQISNARAVLKDPDLARELLKDPTARAVASEAISAHHRAQPVPKVKAPSGDDAFLRCADEMARTEQSLIRLVENLNEGRKNGFLSPSVLREFTEKLRLYAEAIDDIAGSRGLTDEALAEWIGVE